MKLNDPRLDEMFPDMDEKADQLLVDYAIGKLPDPGTQQSSVQKDILYTNNEKWSQMNRKERRKEAKMKRSKKVRRQRRMPVDY